MTKIKAIKARQVLDSRGNPTLETDVVLEDGSLGRTGVPSGSSTGKYEAMELRDKDPAQYGGLSVHTAVDNVNNTIAPALISKDASDQNTLDSLMLQLDGTPNKSKLGANAILGVSLSLAVAQADSEKTELYQYLSKFSPKNTSFTLPFGMFNIINGGVHAPGGSDFQEYMIVPKQSDKFSERLRAASEIFHTLKKILAEQGLATTVGDEGGFAPAVSSNSEALDYIIKAITQAGYKAGENVFIAMDMAATQFYKDGKYHLAKDGKFLDRNQMIDYCAHLTENYPLISIEDPLNEEDFEGWAMLNAKIGSKVQIVGDDLYTTNVQRLKQGIETLSSNAILIKPNQIGTLTETIETIKLAYDNNFKAVISHRSGETADTFIADLSVAMRADQVKFGSLSRSERLAKYDRLLQIEELLTS